MISALASESFTSSGRSRSNRSVGRLSKSLTNACNSVNVFASIAFITIDDTGTFSSLAVVMSIISPRSFTRTVTSDSNIRAAAHPIIPAGRMAVRRGHRAVPIGRRETIKHPEPHQHRQECLCHINPAVLAEMLMDGRAMWHRHSCLCFGRMQSLILLTLTALR